jgi:hypothetical protein
MTLQTGSTPTSGPRSWKALRLAGAFLLGGVMPASARWMPPCR